MPVCARDGSEEQSPRSAASVLRRCPPRTNIIPDNQTLGNAAMAWTTPILVEICIGLEINGYLPAEFSSRPFNRRKVWLTAIVLGLAGCLGMPRPTHGC